MSDYFTCTVKVSKEDVVDFLKNFYDEEEVEDWTDYKLQDCATEAVQGILSDYFSDFFVIDSNTLVVGDF